MEVLFLDALVSPQLGVWRESCLKDSEQTALF